MGLPYIVSNIGRTLQRISVKYYGVVWPPFLHKRVRSKEIGVILVFFVLCFLFALYVIELSLIYLFDSLLLLED